MKMEKNGEHCNCMEFHTVFWALILRIFPPSIPHYSILRFLLFFVLCKFVRHHSSLPAAGKAMYQFHHLRTITPTTTTTTHTRAANGEDLQERSNCPLSRHHVAISSEGYVRSQDSQSSVITKMHSYRTIQQITIFCPPCPCVRSSCDKKLCHHSSRRSW